MPDRTRILFVDDEPAIRLTLPAILVQHGFEVTTAATVCEALREIGRHEFDALISDLNIGEPGDGFTVVSAMRRTQPRCVNFILTGYPAFESALQAIRSQVDDYLVKPADVKELVNLVREKLANPQHSRNVPTQDLSAFLRTHSAEVIDRALEGMKSHPDLGVVPLADDKRVEHIPALLREIVRQLESQTPDDPTREVYRAGWAHGKTRKLQGYSQEMLVDDTRVVDSSIYAVVQDHLLHIKLSKLIPDLSRLNDGLEAHLQGSLAGFNARQAA